MGRISRKETEGDKDGEGGHSNTDMLTMQDVPGPPPTELTTFKHSAE